MAAPLRIVVVTGMSGAGKSTGLRVLEDLGYFCVDNLPTPLVSGFTELAAKREDLKRIALGIDARGRVFGRGAGELPGLLRDSGHEVSVLFLDASDEVLVRRYSESRRPHPFEGGASDVLSGVLAEREASSPLRAQASEVIDTTRLDVHQLRRIIVERFGGDRDGREMVVRLVSFGFRYGVPFDADLVLDVRFLPNPYFVPELKHRSGLEPEVSRFVLAQRESVEFLERFSTLLESLLPLYRREGKSYLTVALGCTGGRHRSVVLVEELARRLGVGGGAVLHRDVNRREEERMASQDAVAR